MIATINFEAEFEIGAVEIDDVFADWMLAAELVTAELTVAQEAPDHILLGRQLATRSPCESPEAWHRMRHDSRGYLGVARCGPLIRPSGTFSPADAGEKGEHWSLAASVEIEGRSREAKGSCTAARFPRTRWI